MKIKILKIAFAIVITAMVATYAWYEYGENFTTCNELKANIYTTDSIGVIDLKQDSLMVVKFRGDTVDILKEGEYEIKSYKLLK